MLHIISQNAISSAFDYLEQDFKEFRVEAERTISFNQQHSIEMMPSQQRKYQMMADNLIQDIQKIKRFLVPRYDDFENNSQPQQQVAPQPTPQQSAPLTP